MSVKSIRVLFVCLLFVAQASRFQPVAIAQSPTGSKAQSATVAAPTGDPLLRLLVSKGVLTTGEAAVVLSSGTSAQQRDRPATLLKDKGLISNAEFDALQTAVSEGNTVNANATPSNSNASAGRATAAGGPKPVAPPPVIAAVAPIRLLPIEPQAREGLIPDLKLGSGARIKPYGYFKTSVIHDSSSPLGNDFPLPLLAADTGPNGSPEFHLKARALRLGVNFEWLAPAPKTVITGLYYGFDEALPQAARRFSPVRGKSDLFSGNIQYKLNSWITFAFEQGYYRTRATNRSALDFGGLPLFRGIPSYTSHNVRSEPVDNDELIKEVFRLIAEARNGNPK
jgi:hypothetical protein